jgi:hypothetical protein
MKKLVGLFFLLIFLTTSINVIAQTVYVTKTGSKFHNDGCRYLSQSKISLDLSAAIAKGYGPCSVCKPPTQTSNIKAASATPEKREVKQQVNSQTNTVSQQCAAITKAGTRCTRKAEVGSIYCWQHKK